MLGFTFKYKNINDLVSNDYFIYVLQIKFHNKTRTKIKINSTKHI